nr:bifunctional 5,10-methylenetetrahydrofolate dehydrogenase/5,10-methenyltetrahydrofolate cyclohydrolase [Candidatus Gracilibacteria bacterium]
MIIDGKKIAKEMYEKIKDEILITGKKLRLQAILVGNNSSSLRYISQKRKWAEYVGIDFKLEHLDESITEEALLGKIEEYNKDSNTTGILVQLPLPSHIDTKKVINLINPKKDVDGFHSENQGKILLGDDTGLFPCTPAGVMEIFNYLGLDLTGKLVTVIGRSNIVGKPLVAMLINSGATTICCNSKTKKIEEFTKISDIVICAAGSPGLLTLDMINSKTVVIDVGFTVVNDKIYGDVKFDEINNNGNMITPVPGGVGALTVANLMSNILKADRIQNEK